MQIEGVLEKLQDAIEWHLLSLNELRNIPILTYKQSDLNSTIAANIKSGVGTSILLMPPIPSFVLQHVAGPVFSSVNIEVNIVENTVANRNRRSLLFFAEVIMQNLHMWRPNVEDENYQLELAPGTGCCKATSQDGVNCFSICFVMPCHLKLYRS